MYAVLESSDLNLLCATDHSRNLIEPINSFLKAFKFINKMHRTKKEANYVGIQLSKYYKGICDIVTYMFLF